ncbi:DUF4870 domain-containing protein [Natrialba swarupiae]|uniref:DUF4870 domain-containing protein n=1 Tax=Natrialba swarupiae TaxID=2448032 RepID=A0A5D5ASE6_9EURY|nr:hypothetical protein [Natrialba swarupiae]TYT61991.1 hypothetical protein FYC77_10990 [Natrialba swarupiae]
MATENVTAVESSASNETSLGPDGNVVAMLAYFFAPVCGVLVYALEEQNGFARYHAAQSIVFGLLVIAAYVGLWTISFVISMLVGEVPIIGFLLSILVGIIDAVITLVVWLAAFLVWLYLVAKAYQGEAVSLPLVTAIAEKHLL